MWRVKCESDSFCRELRVGLDAPPLTLQHGKDGDVITQVQVEWDGRNPRVCIVICKGRAYVRRGARPFLALAAPDRIEVPAARLGTLVVALDAAWLRCYRFFCEGRQGGGRVPWSVRQHLRLWLLETFPCLPPLRRRLWRALRRYVDWSEDGLCTAAARAVAAPEPGGAWRAFERLYLQLDRQDTPCSPYRHLVADLCAPGGGRFC